MQKQMCKILEYLVLQLVLILGSSCIVIKNQESDKKYNCEDPRNLTENEKKEILVVRPINRFRLDNAMKAEAPLSWPVERAYIHYCYAGVYIAKYKEVCDDSNLDSSLEVEVEISFHTKAQKCPTKWLLHDVYYYFVIKQKNERGEPEILSKRIDGNWVLVFEHGEELLEVAWISQIPRLTLVTVCLNPLYKKCKKVQLENPVILAYLEKYPSCLTEAELNQEHDPESYYKREIERCLEYVRDREQAWMSRRVWGALLVYTGYSFGRPLEEYERPITPGQAYKRMKTWWDKHKHLSLTELYSRAVDRSLERLKETTDPEIFIGRLYELSVIAMHAHPPTEYHRIEGEDMTRFKEIWTRWWKVCRGKPPIEQFRYTVDLYLDLLDEKKIKEEGEARDSIYADYILDLSPIIGNLRHTMTKEINWHSWKGIKETIRYLKKWWKQNRDTCNPYPDTRFVHLPYFYWR